MWVSLQGLYIIRNVFKSSTSLYNPSGILGKPDILKVCTRDSKEGFFLGKSIDEAKYASEPVNDGKIHNDPEEWNVWVGEDDKETETVEGGRKSSIAVMLIIY